jgi:hypothetical protein
MLSFKSIYNGRVMIVGPNFRLSRGLKLQVPLQVPNNLLSLGRLKFHPMTWKNGGANFQPCHSMRRQEPTLTKLNARSL